MNKLYRIFYNLLVAICFSISVTTVPVDEFYAYGVEHGDIRLNPRNKDDGSSDEIQLTAGFRYFDTTHHSLWVNVNGAISFRQAIATYTPVCVPVSREFTMIAPFWADVDLSYGGDILYRDTTEPTVLNKASNDIMRAFPEFSGVEVTWAFVTTWLNVSYYGANGCSVRSRNTFQSVLASNGAHSFAIFNYNDITWTTGLASGGQCPGIGGTPAKAGFDPADGASLFSIPGSCTNDIISINKRSNMNEPGMWLFRVDNETIKSAGCEPKFSSMLSVVPNFVNMYGHVPLQLSGPCFDATDDIICRFMDKVKGPIDVQCIVDGLPSNHRALCIAPYLYSGGRMNIDLIVNRNGSETIYNGYLYVIEPRENDKQVDILITNASNTEINIKFTWNTTYFDANTTLSIQMYTFDDANDEWSRVMTMVDNISNSGHYASNFNKLLLPEEIWNSATIVSVEPTGSKVTRFKRGFWSDLGKALFSAFVNVVEFFDDIFGDTCMEWYRGDPGGPTDLIPCPPTVTQFQADPRYEIDPGCTSAPCEFHPGADFCIRSRTPSPSGGGQQCCYLGDKILLGPRGGGTVDKSHHKNGFLKIDHFNADVLPWIKCCKDKSDQLCHRYYEKRPSDPGTNYEPPQPSGASGDPHISTFDGVDYTFNGAGEFWLIRDGPGMPMAVQSRMEIYVDNKGDARNATIFTAFAMKGRYTPLIQVQKSMLRTVDIYVDNFIMDLSVPELYDTTYNGVQVTIASDRSMVTISFASGFNFVISTNGQAFSIFSTCDKKYINKTRGLLGVYDGIKENDLQDQHGNIIDITSSQSDIHYKFGLKWRVLAADSLFLYTAKKYDDYNIESFAPDLTDPSMFNVTEHAQMLCGQSIDCLYDYIATGSASVANHTKSVRNDYNQIVRIYENKVTTCPPLSYPDNGYFHAENFLPGSVASYGCFENFTLRGIVTIKCHDNGTWSDSAPICESQNDTNDQGNNTEQGGLLYIILVGILVLVTFAITLIIFRRYYSARKRRLYNQVY